MKVKVSALEIPKDDSFKNDALNRKESAEILTQLFSTIEEPFVLSIDSPWGSGKTTFIKMWGQYLLDCGYKYIYFNAWENDINENSLTALIAEIKKTIEISPNKEKSKQIFENIMNISRKIVKKAIPTIIKIGTAGVINVDDFTEEAISSATEKYALETIEECERKQEQISAFKQELEKYAQSIYEEENKPLIFFIDELDRCRPNFAIEILEKAKHFFSVKNIVFVIAIDKKELGNSIKAIYGNDFDTNGYLRRFIDLTYIFPSFDIGTYCKFLINRFSFETFFQSRTKYSELRNDEDNLVKICQYLFSLKKFSLRTIEQCFTQVSLVLKTTKENEYLHPIYLIFLIILKNDNSDLYLRIKQNQCSIEEMLEYMYSLDREGNFINEHFGRLLEAYIVYSLINYFRYDYNENKKGYLNEKYVTKVNDPNIPENEKQRAKHILDMINNLSYRYDYNLLENLLKKIDISARFQ